MYRETLRNQWVNLYSDFDHDFEMLKNQGKVPDGFNRWYQTRIHRWKSIAYSEGILLEQVNNVEFANELQETMEKFSFQFIEPKEDKPVWIGIAVGIIAGVSTGVILRVFHWGTVKVVISGIVVSAVVATVLLQSDTARKKKEQGRVKEGYIEQLKDYGKVLMELCDRYNI